MQVALLPKDDGSMQKKVEDLRKEVEQLKRSLAREVITLSTLNVSVCRPLSLCLITRFIIWMI
jgi:hypothetical protein